MPAVLVNPGKPCPTPEVFRRCKKHSGAAQADWRANGNDLQDAAIEIVPEIADVLAALGGADIARMSGSGATCFGVYANAEAAQSAARQIAEAHPQWWVRAGTLNP
jgi:4-diphosphocytidyl-2-C-methyl-D-erythritol kinase